MARLCAVWALLLLVSSCSSVFGMQGRGKEVVSTFYDFLGTTQPPLSSSSSDEEAYGELDGTMQSQQDDADASNNSSQQHLENPNAGPVPQYQLEPVQHRAASIADLRAEIKNRVWKSFRQSWHETIEHYEERRKRSYNRFVKKQERDQRLVAKFIMQYRGDEAAITAAYYDHQEQVVLRHRLSARLHYAKAMNRDQEELQTVYDQVRDNVFESTIGVAVNTEPQEMVHDEDSKTLHASARQLTMAKARLRRDLKAGVDPAIIERRMKRWKIESLEDGRSKGAIKTAIRKQLKLEPDNEAVRARARKYGMNPDVQPFRSARGPVSRPYNWQQHAGDMVGDSSSSASVVSPVLWEDQRVQDVPAGSAQEAAPAFHWDLNGMPSP